VSKQDIFHIQPPPEYTYIPQTKSKVKALSGLIKYINNFNQKKTQFNVNNKKLY